MNSMCMFSASCNMKKLPGSEHNTFFNTATSELQPAAAAAGAASGCALKIRLPWQFGEQD
jgi:hypothetical protein